MKNIFKIIMVSGIVLTLFSGTVSACAGGHTPGWWKKDRPAWDTTQYTQGTLLTDVFTIPSRPGFDYFDGKTFYHALRFHGGPGLVGAARILFRAAVAALLNADSYHPDWFYPYYVADIISDVNLVLTQQRSNMLTLAGIFDNFNNLGVPE